MYTIVKEVALLLFNNLHEKRITEKTRDKILAAHEHFL